MKSIIKGGTLVYSGGVKQEDMLICDGRIEWIKETIHPTGEEQIIDATSYYVLPGFIASEDSLMDSAYEHGVTTFIRSSEGIVGEEGHQAMSDIYDYVYRVSIKKWNKNILQDLYLSQVKVIELDSALLHQTNWEEWQPRLKRYGIVLEVVEEDYPLLKERDIPLIVSFNKGKRMSGTRTVTRVMREQVSKWEKTVGKTDPFVLSGFWTDVVEYPLPRLVENEVVPFLMRLAKTRSSIPAKVFGIYPRKGSLCMGADADFLFVSKETMIKGNETNFKPEQTWIKGVCCVKNENTKGMGRQLPCHMTYAFAF